MSEGDKSYSRMVRSAELIDLFSLFLSSVFLYLWAYLQIEKMVAVRLLPAHTAPIACSAWERRPFVHTSINSREGVLLTVLGHMLASRMVTMSSSLSMLGCHPRKGTAPVGPPGMRWSGFGFKRMWAVTRIPQMRKCFLGLQCSFLMVPYIFEPFYPNRITWN